MLASVHRNAGLLTHRVSNVSIMSLARGGKIIGIGLRNDEAFDFHIPIADLGEASGVVQAVPAQSLGYYLALLRGHDPDKPRNLAKSVTVK